jgi:nicotinamide riboside kinase
MMHKQPIRVLITGPESTGKSTIASYISDKWEFKLVKEYAREYLELKHGTYVKDDLLDIAKAHHDLVESTTATHNNLVLDTYLLNIKIWSEYKYDSCDPWILNTLNSITIDHVFLTTAGVPWTFDPLRENENNREELFYIFKKELERLNWTYTVLKNDKKEREKQIDGFITDLITKA